MSSHPHQFRPAPSPTYTVCSHVQPDVIARAHRGADGSSKPGLVRRRTLGITRCGERFRSLKNLHRSRSSHDRVRIPRAYAVMGLVTSRTPGSMVAYLKIMTRANSFCLVRDQGYIYIWQAYGHSHSRGGCQCMIT